MEERRVEAKEEPNHNKTNNRFTITEFQSTELQAAAYRVDVSPAWAWEQTGGAARTFAYIFLVIMWVAIFLVAGDFHLRFGSEKSTAGKWMITMPLVLCVALFLGGSSNVTANNYEQVSAPKFSEWVANGDIDKKGERTWVDASESKVLWHLFDGKKPIR